MGGLVGAHAGEKIARFTPAQLGFQTDVEKQIVVCYEELNVSPLASNTELNRGYRTKVLITHPDKEGGSAQAFAKLNACLELIRKERGDHAQNENEVEL